MATTPDHGPHEALLDAYYSQSRTPASRRYGGDDWFSYAFHAFRRRKFFYLLTLAIFVSLVIIFNLVSNVSYYAVSPGTDVLSDAVGGGLPGGGVGVVGAKEGVTVYDTYTHTTTATVAAPTVTETVVHEVQAKQEPVSFALIMWSEHSAVEGALLIKSILLHSSAPTDFHIICDEGARTVLESRLSLVTRPYRDVRVRYYLPSWQAMQDRVDREGSIKTDHSAGLPGLMKLFLHELLPPSVKKAIYVDTDALFIADPALLWGVFAGLQPQTAIVMSSHPTENSEEWHHASRICSCVMLLDLEKLRTLRLMDSSIYRQHAVEGEVKALAPEAFRALYGEPAGEGGKYDNVRLGDQGYWWAIVDYRKDIFEPLSYDFEVTSCLFDTYLTGLGDDTRTMEDEIEAELHVKDTPQEGNAVLPKLLHFNCLHGTDVYMSWPGWSDPSDGLAQRWGPAVRYHDGFKWIWLNQRSGEDTKMERSTVGEVMFADEVYARERAAQGGA